MSILPYTTAVVKITDIRNMCRRSKSQLPAATRNSPEDTAVTKLINYLNYAKHFDI